MLDGLSPEVQFLLAAVQPEFPGSKIHQWVHKDLDWDFLFKAAQHHLVIPLVYQTLSFMPSQTAPRQVLDNFRISSSKIAARNLVLGRELVGILQMFQEGNIPVIALKGPILTERLYKNAALRHYDDLDLLIHKKDVLRAKGLLLSAGYRPKKDLADLAPAQEKAFLHFHYTYDFISKNSGHQLEVHWELVAKSFSLNLDYEGLWKRCVEFRFDKATVPVFSPEDLLLTLCLTGAKKGWDRLLRVSDVARALLLYPDLNWEQVAEHARKAGAERMFLLGLSLASALFESRLPQPIRLRIGREGAVRRLTANVILRMFRPEAESATMIQPEDQFQPIHVRIRERLWDRIRYCVKVTLTPGVGEWAVISLPGPLYFLYYFLRPFRLLLKTVKRLLVFFQASILRILHNVFSKIFRRTT